MQAQGERSAWEWDVCQAPPAPSRDSTERFQDAALQQRGVACKKVEDRDFFLFFPLTKLLSEKKVIRAVALFGGAFLYFLYNHTHDKTAQAFIRIRSKLIQIFHY
jgi:hypothetical protein